KSVGCGRKRLPQLALQAGGGFLGLAAGRLRLPERSGGRQRRRKPKNHSPMHNGAGLRCEAETPGRRAEPGWGAAVRRVVGKAQRLKPGGRGFGRAVFHRIEQRVAAAFNARIAPAEGPAAGQFAAFWYKTQPGG